MTQEQAELPVLESVDMNALLDLSIGDVVELDALLPGLSDAKLILETAHRTGDSATFKVMYEGVWLCNRSLKRNEQGEFTWA